MAATVMVAASGDDVARKMVIVAILEFAQCIRVQQWVPRFKSAP